MKKSDCKYRIFVNPHIQGKYALGISNTKTGKEYLVVGRAGWIVERDALPNVYACKAFDGKAGCNKFMADLPENIPTHNLNSIKAYYGFRKASIQ